MTDININVNLNLETLGLSFAAKNNTTSNRRDSIESKSAQKQTRKELTKRTTSKVSPSLTTLSSSSSKTKAPLINTAPYRPNPGRKDTIVTLIPRIGAGSFLVIPGGTWGYESAYGLNNEYFWPRDGLEFPLNPAKINTAPSRDSGLFLYALLCDSFTEYPDFEEYNRDVLGSISYQIGLTTAQRDNTPLYSESDGAFVGRIHLQGRIVKTNRLPYSAGGSGQMVPGSTRTENVRKYVNHIRFALVTSKVRPPDITMRDWGPDPRVGADNTSLVGLYTPFDQYKPNQNVLAQGRTFEFLCWTSNTEITQLVPAQGAQDIQGTIYFESNFGVCNMVVNWAGIIFGCYCFGRYWASIGSQNDTLGLFFPAPPEVRLVTAGGQALEVSLKGTRNYIRPGQWNHVAMVVSQEEARVYLNGQKMASIAQPYRNFSSEEYDKLVATMGITTIELYNSGYADAIVTDTYSAINVPPINVDYRSGINYSQAIGPPKIKGIRYTERPLYFGDSFNPPSGILGFA